MYAHFWTGQSGIGRVDIVKPLVAVSLFCGRFSLCERHESIREPKLRRLDGFDALRMQVQNIKIVDFGISGTNTRIFVVFRHFLLVCAVVHGLNILLIRTIAITYFVVGGLFLIDMIIIFNSDNYNDDFEVISDRSTIVTMYLQSWFALDVIAIFPFELYMSQGCYNLSKMASLTLNRVAHASICARLQNCKSALSCIVRIIG